jgi:hypothetical protein
MSDSRKTKIELIAELNNLRKSIDALKKKHKQVGGEEKAPSKSAKSRDNRLPIKADIELIGVFDLVKAKAINVSEGGISLKISNNLPFEMRYKLEEKTVSRTAHLIWVKHTQNGGYNFGFKFVKGETFPDF